MGLFSRNETCPICGNPVKGMIHAKIKDKVQLCNECTSKLGMEQSMIAFQSVDDIKEHIAYREQNYQEFLLFNVTNEKKTNRAFFREDSNMKRWYCSFVKNPKNPTVYRFDQIVDYELTEDGNSVTKGGLGKAVAGGLLFGGVGAVVGGVTAKKKTRNVIKSMKLRISLNHKYKNQVVIDFIPFGTDCKSGSMTYNFYKQQANDIISFLDSIYSKAEVSQQASSVQQASGAGEIMKYKQLLDGGIISQEEFDAKKKQILGI